MVRRMRWSVIAGASIMALLLGVCMLEVNVYGSVFVTNAVLEEIPAEEALGEEIFSDGSEAQEQTGNEEQDAAGTGGNVDMGGAGSYIGGYSPAPAPGEKILRQPKLMLESCNLSGADIQAGSEQALEAVLVNRSSSERIYNLKVTLVSEAKDIYLSEKSFYVTSMAAKEKISLNSVVKIMPGAEEGIFPINLSFEYEDKKGTACTGAEKLEIRVIQPAQVHMECGQLPGTAAATDTLLVPVKIQNLSRAKVYNVRVSLKGKGLFPRDEVFVGNMEAGTQGEGTMQIYVGTRTMEQPGKDEGSSEREMYGETKGKLTLFYEDSAGNKHKEEKKFKLEITKPKIQSLKVEKPKEANSWWVSVIAVSGMGMLGVILLLIRGLHRQKIRIEEMKKMYGGNI